MSIQTHALQTASNQPLSYLDAGQLPLILHQLEGYKQLPYLDGATKGYLTVGIGINIAHHYKNGDGTQKDQSTDANLALVLDEMGIFAGALQDIPNATDAQRKARMRE